MGESAATIHREGTMSDQNNTTRDGTGGSPSDELGQSRGKWTGQVQVGNRTLGEKRARREIRALCTRIETLATEGRNNEVRGTMRRISHMLAAFVLHPCGSSAVELARLIYEQRSEVAEAPVLMDRVMDWLDVCASTPVPLDLESLLPVKPRKRRRRNLRTEGMLDATLICPWCGFRAPPGSEHLLCDIGQDTLIGLHMGPKVCVVCPICGEGFRWLDPELNPSSYDPYGMLMDLEDED